MTIHPTDEALARDGFAKVGSGRTLLLACGALAREILDVIRLNDWTHLDLKCHFFSENATSARYVRKCYMNVSFQFYLAGPIEEWFQAPQLSDRFRPPPVSLCK